MNMIYALIIIATIAAFVLFCKVGNALASRFLT